jgi:hypothetical protein
MLQGMRRWPCVGRRVALLVVLGGSVSACHWGTRPKKLRVATGAAGAQVAVRVNGESRDRLGELLAVDSAGLYLAHASTAPAATARTLTFIVWPRIRAIDVDQLGDGYDLRAGQRADQAFRGRLALVSRFRLLTPELRDRVLREFRQDTLDVVR